MYKMKNNLNGMIHAEKHSTERVRERERQREREGSRKGNMEYYNKLFYSVTVQIAHIAIRCIRREHAWTPKAR